MDAKRIARHIVRAAVRLPAWAKGLSVPEKHQLRIALDTVENPSKALLGGPSAEEAEEIVMMLKDRASGKQGSDRMAGGVKRWLENVSVDMGFGGEINNEVMAEGQRRWDQPEAGAEEDNGEKVVAAAAEMATKMRTIADRLDRLTSLRQGEGGAPMKLPETIDLFRGAFMSIESLIFDKKKLLDAIQYPHP